MTTRFDAVLATHKLKKRFSILFTIQENRQLITSGIYSTIRYPVYLGTMLAMRNPMDRMLHVVITSATMKLTTGNSAPAG